MDNSHIGPEHGHARTAIYDRARQLLAAGRLAEPARVEEDSAPTANVPIANAPIAAPPARPEPASRAPLPERAATPDPDEDLEYLDGRWTSEGW